MKILCIIQCSNLGGMEQSALRSLCLLKEQGHEVSIFSLHPVGELKSLANMQGISLVGTSRYRLMGIGNICQILKEIRQSRPDRLFLVGHNVGGLIAARISGVPAFLSIHFHHGDRSMYFWRVIYGLAKKCVKRIRFNSRYIWDEVYDIFKPSDGVVCFPNIFSSPPSLLEKSIGRKQLNIPENAFVVGNAGWLIPRKAFDVFLKTAAVIHKEIPEAVFVIAGDGPERKSLEMLVDRLGIRESVIFLGWQKDLLPFYSSLDVLLFNSNFDALARTPVEALSNGIPVVCSETHGGLSEFIRHRQDGFLIDHHDTESLAAEIVHLYQDEEYRNKAATSGRQRVLDLGSPEKHLKHLNEFLELT